MQNINNNQTLLAEASAAALALNKAVSRKMPYCIFEGDNQTVIDCLKGIIQRPWEISNAFGFANSLKPSLEYVVFTKVYGT